jgi:hypothetical protein
VAREYLERRAAEGWTAERGFIDFVQSLDDAPDETAAREFWRRSLD